MKKTVLMALGTMAFVCAQADTQNVKMVTNKEVGATLTFLVNNSKTGVMMDWGDGTPVAYTQVVDGVIEVTGQVKGKDLVLSSERSITMLGAEDCGLSSIVLSNATDLISLYVQNNNLTTIDVSKLAKLRDLNVANNALAKVTISTTANPYIETLNISNNPLTSTAFTYAAESLQYLNLAGNQYKTLTLTKNVNLSSLVADKNQLTTLSLVNAGDISLVSATGNALTTLKLPTEAPELQQLIVGENELSGTLALTASKKLTTLDVHSNNYSLVQLPSAKLLVYDCSDNALTFSSLPKLTYKPTVYLKYDTQANFDMTTLTGIDPSGFLPHAIMSPGYDSRTDAAYVVDMVALRGGSTSASVKLNFFEVKEDGTEVALIQASATDREKDFTNISGKVTFQRAMDKVVCEMTDDGYPDLKVRTTYFAVINPNAPEGVEMVATDNCLPTSAYDLSGRSINTAGQKGLYIINNKKVILK